MADKTNKEKFESGNGKAIAFALLDAFRATGANDAQIWELTEPHNCPLLLKAVNSLGTRKPNSAQNELQNV